VDRETTSRTDDHQALRLWLRLLTCTQLIEREVRARLRMNELSRHLMVTGGNVTGIVDLLEKDGQVERAAEPSDRRAYRVRLTGAGRKAFAEMARAHEAWIVELLAGLSRREHAEIYRLLGKVKQVTLEAKS
jgi:DNA-binding MarR family transcriptional regulator